jgi:hypothetical protein
LQVQIKAVPLHPQSRNDGYSMTPQGAEREIVRIAKREFFERFIDKTTK